MNIKQLLSACILGTAIASCSFPSTEREGIVINLQEKGAEIALSMYGVFLKRLIMPVMEDYMPSWCRTVVSRNMRCRQGIMWKEIN